MSEFITASPGFVQRLRNLFGLDIVEKNSLEEYCLLKYRLIDNIAYENKRSFKQVSYSTYLNEIITPDAFMVARLKKGVLFKDDINQRVRNLGNVLSRVLTWTSDKDLSGSDDYYQYPGETLAIGKGDCEDHAFVMASALPEDLGVAYGFWDDGNQRFGHAFNVFVDGGKLYTLDTVGNAVDIREYDSQSPFKIHYIITKKRTFEVRKGTSFGQIAGW